MGRFHLPMHGRTHVPGGSDPIPVTTGGAPSVASFWRDSVSLGDDQLSVPADTDSLIPWLHNSLPSDGLIVVGSLSSHVKFTAPCMTQMWLYTRWETAAARRSGSIADHPARFGDVWDVTLSYASDGNEDLSATGYSNMATMDSRPAAYIADDEIWTYASNGDSSAHNLNSAIFIIYAWATPDYSGGVPGWPE